MVTYVARRLVLAALVLFAVITVTFFMLYLTGNPIAAILRQAGSSPAAIAQVRHALGYDRPLLVQYVHFLGDLAHGDFGTSIQYGQPALTLVLQHVPYTIELAVAAMLLAMLLATPIGVSAAIHHGQFADRLLSLGVAFFQAVPSFVLGPLLILVVAVWLGALPVSGADTLASLVLPAVTLALYPATVMARLLRASVLDVADADFVVTARSKGLREARVLFIHILRNASLPALTVTGLQVAELLGGAVIVEAIFGWPGVGEFSRQALLSSDFPVIRTVILLVAVVVILINLATDLLYAVIDPRIRETTGASAR